MKRIYIIFVTFVSMLIISCSSTQEIDTSTAEGGYKQGKILEKAERFEEAIAQYTATKNEHPYSRFAIESELAIANIHFEREAFIEAQGAYQLFKDFHPKHPKIDYVTYRLALSYFRQLPSTIDRDLTLARQAIFYFDETMKSFPNSEFASKAKKKKLESLKMLAAKENYIANFYFIRDKYDSALGRYEDLMRKYPGKGFDAKALMGAAISSHKIKDLAKARKYYDILGKRFPNSKEYKKTRKELGYGD